MPIFRWKAAWGGAVLIDGVPYTGAKRAQRRVSGHICVQPRRAALPVRPARVPGGRTAPRPGLSTDLGVTVEQFFAGLEAGNLAYRTLWSDYLRHLAVGAGLDPHGAGLQTSCWGGYLAQ